MKTIYEYFNDIAYNIRGDDNILLHKDIIDVTRVTYKTFFMIESIFSTNSARELNDLFINMHQHVCCMILTNIRRMYVISSGTCCITESRQ